MPDFSRSILKFLTVVVFFFSMLVQSFAVNPDEVLKDSALEARARALSAEIRCLVCQNQSIDDSDAQLARDLRVLVREKLVEGLSDEEILDFLVARYGEFVLLKPPFAAHTLVLWILPLIALLSGLWGARTLFNRAGKATAQTKELSDEEKKALLKILDKE
ncbi:MAG: cytochrome c-type biogenesis protein [Pseudomonadota bacterium]